MSIKIINTSATGITNNVATIKSTYINCQTYNVNPASLPIGIDGPSRFELNPKGMFSLGTGQVVTTNAIELYNASNGSGLIDNFLVINRSNTTAFIGVNTTNMAIANGLPIGSGESYLFQNKVYNIWAMTSGGSGIIAGGGPYNTNGNMV